MDHEKLYKPNKVVAIIGFQDFANKALVSQTMAEIQEKYRVTHVVFK